MPGLQNTPNNKEDIQDMVEIVVKKEARVLLL